MNRVNSQLGIVLNGSPSLCEQLEKGCSATTDNEGITLDCFAFCAIDLGYLDTTDLFLPPRLGDSKPSDHLNTHGLELITELLLFNLGSEIDQAYQI